MSELQQGEINITFNYKLIHLFGANIVTSIGSGITAFIIPYLIINMHDGAKKFGYLFIAINLLVFFLSPYLGLIVDRYSRKKVLIFCELQNIAATSVLVGCHFIYGSIPFSLLAVQSVLSTIYYSLQFPALMAFTQEIFNKDEFRKINSAIEVQSQAAAFISAGLVGVLIMTLNVVTILMLDMVSSVMAIIWFLFIPYKLKDKDSSTEPKSKKTLRNDVSEAWGYVKNNRYLIIFLMVALFPSIMVLIGNYVNPIFLYTDLNQLPDVQGYSSFIYAFSAMLGGIIASYLAKYMGSFNSIFVTFTLYLIFNLGVYLFPALIPFLALRSLAGIGNSATRVLRKNIMMEHIPNHLIGKVNSIFNSFSLLMQSIIVAFFTFTITNTGARQTFLTVTLILSAGLIFMIAIYYGSIKRKSLSFVRSKNTIGK
ncbi:MFS transporter [Paenibacillus sp. GCM10012307]|uniref:MFS transporter n=1 Tax=Paenibacillus roseus TaxID=2798579 RepID=A0A934MPK8_9BACL|nr:MFS transporter [Paenibacillus roseus]MBJ6362186.1 MFS transporter [Paenibacillus roseus]